MLSGREAAQEPGEENRTDETESAPPEPGGRRLAATSRGEVN
jgi:hypothetical protein